MFVNVTGDTDHTQSIENPKIAHVVLALALKYLVPDTTFSMLSSSPSTDLIQVLSFLCHFHANAARSGVATFPQMNSSHSANLIHVNNFLSRFVASDARAIFSDDCLFPFQHL